MFHILLLFIVNWLDIYFSYEILCISGVTSYYDSQGNIRDFSKIRSSILSVLIGVGVVPSLPKLVKAGPPAVLSVLLDGRVVGAIPSSEVEKAVAHLRRLKVLASSVVCLNICQYANCFIFLQYFLLFYEIADS